MENMHSGEQSVSPELFIRNGSASGAGSSIQWRAVACDAKEHDQAIQLNRHVTALAETIGERNIAHYAELQKSSAYIIHEFRQIGYDPREEEYVADDKLLRISKFS